MFYAIKRNLMTIISLPLMPQKKKRKKSFDPSGNEHEAPDFGSRSFGSCGFQGVASFEWACSGASHRWWLDWDLQSLEARLMLWALCFLNCFPKHFCNVVPLMRQSTLFTLTSVGLMLWLLKHMPQPVCTHWKSDLLFSGSSGNMRSRSMS